MNEIANILKIILIAGAATEAGKRLIPPLMEVSKQALANFENECRTIQVVRSTMSARASLFTKKLSGNAIFDAG